MGVFTIAVYRPKPGKQADLEQVVREHVPILRKEGLATDRVSHMMRAKDGTIVEVFEWCSTDAIAAAHKNPNVLAMWGRFDQACELIKLDDLPETKELFPGFDPLDL